MKRHSNLLQVAYRKNCIVLVFTFWVFSFYRNIVEKGKNKKKNFELFSHLVLVFLLSTLSMHLFDLCDLFYISIVSSLMAASFILFLERFSRNWNA